MPVAIGPRARRASLVALWGFAVALLWTFVVFPRFSAIEPLFDVNAFGRIGESIHSGEGFSRGYGPTLRRAPLYPYLVAGVLGLGGFDPAHRQQSYVPLLVLQCAFAGIWCAISLLIADTLFGPRAGLAAGLLCSVYPQCLRYLGAVEVEATMTLLITLMTWTSLRLVRRPSACAAAAGGLVTGLAVLAKPLPLLYPLVVAWLLWTRARRRRERYPAAALAIYVVVMAIVVAPWVVRNHLVTHGRYLGISANASGEFLRGYVTAWPEFWLLRRPFRGNWDVAANRFEAALLRRHGLDYDTFRKESVGNSLLKDRVENRIAARMVIGRPLVFARKVAIQALTFWYLVETPAKSLAVGLLALLALGLAARGASLAWRNGVSVAPLVATVLYFNVLYAVVLAFARYSMPVFPSLLALSAGGLVGCSPRCAKLGAAARECADAPAAAHLACGKLSPHE